MSIDSRTKSVNHVQRFTAIFAMIFFIAVAKAMAMSQDVVVEVAVTAADSQKAYASVTVKNSTSNVIVISPSDLQLFAKIGSATQFSPMHSSCHAHFHGPSDYRVRTADGSVSTSPPDNDVYLASPPPLLILQKGQSAIIDEKFFDSNCGPIVPSKPYQIYAEGGWRFVDDSKSIVHYFKSSIASN